MSVDFCEMASYYDAMYVEPEAYRREAGQTADLIRRYNRSGSTALLDLACGTGEQSRLLAKDFEVTGIDLSEDMLQIARQKAPGASFLQGDIFHFSMPNRFGAVINLYGSVGFARDLAEMERGLACAYESLLPGGVFLLTPWETRETFREELVADSGQRDGLYYCRMEAVRRMDDTHATVEMHHLIGRDGEIAEHRTVQQISLFSEREYRNALTGAGFQIVRRLSEDAFRMGAFVATKPLDS